MRAPIASVSSKAETGIPLVSAKTMRPATSPVARNSSIGDHAIASTSDLWNLVAREWCLSDGRSCAIPNQIAKDADEIATDCATDTAIVHLEEFLFRVDDEFVIDADLN